MPDNKTISIDGQQYDAVTGLPLNSEASAKTPAETSVSIKVQSTSATALHQITQRSTTLHRKVVKKPKLVKHQIIGHPTVKHMDISRPHSSIRKFAPHPVGAINPIKPATDVSIDIAPVTHPHVAKAHAKSLAKEQSLTKTISSSEIKDEAIKKAIAGTSKKPFLKSRMQARQRIVSVLTASFALVLLGGYFTYLNMPALSVRVAAAQAGIDANFPNYRPDGYALSGPVTYTDGRVSMNFKANGGNQGFTINQAKSGWDSGALLDNYVSPKAGGSYVPYTERGLTIYTYDNNAAWVNGGILYTVEGDAPLSSSQIRRIATSLL